MSKIDKERILRNLTSWSLTDENEFAGTSWQYCGGPGPLIRLEESETAEVKKAIIKMVSKKPQTWRIEEKNNFHNPHFFLVHQSVKELEIGFGDQIIRNFGKVHNKKGFTKGEWQELEQIITESTNNTTNANWTWKEYGLVGAGIIVVVVFAYSLVRKYFL